ncbi:MAG: hypothetical protein D6814_07430 [Calditrichaeota bacterium]|nr:MAG: hypothetical protein D6814_07430 [Calditrichota bacterium]
MGRTLLILIFGFSAAFTLFSVSRNKRVVDSTERLASQFANYSVNNAAASGVYMALNQLYQDITWRAGYSNLNLNGDSISVTLEDSNTNPVIPQNQVRILATAAGRTAARTYEVMVFDSKFNGFAVWAKDSVLYVTTMDSVGNIAPGLLMEHAPFMPNIDQNQVITEATNQGHVILPDSGGTFVPPNGYPNGNFYYSGLTPNVIQVKGDMQVKKERTIYGIYLVEGKVRLDKNAVVNGILYLPNKSNIIKNSNSHNSYVNGGIITWDVVFGNFGQINVQLIPEYMNRFVGNFVPNNPPLRVISWK